MDVKQKVSAALREVLSSAGRLGAERGTCELCVRVARREPREATDEDRLSDPHLEVGDAIKDPLLDALTSVVQYGDENKYRIKMCPRCGQFYVYWYTSGSIASIISDDAGWNPAREHIHAVSADEAVSFLVEHTYSPHHFKRMIYKDGLCIFSYREGPLEDARDLDLS